MDKCVSYTILGQNPWRHPFPEIVLNQGTSRCPRSTLLIGCPGDHIGVAGTQAGASVQNQHRAEHCCSFKGFSPPSRNKSAAAAEIYYVTPFIALLLSSVLLVYFYHWENYIFCKGVATPPIGVG